MAIVESGGCIPIRHADEVRAGDVLTQASNPSPDVFLVVTVSIKPPEPASYVNRRYHFELLTSEGSIIQCPESMLAWKSLAKVEL